MRLVCIIGPPSVGKMTVGGEVCARTGFRLFPNHTSIEPLLGSSTSARRRSSASTA